MKVQTILAIMITHTFLGISLIPNLSLKSILFLQNKIAIDVTGKIVEIPIPTSQYGKR